MVPQQLLERAQGLTARGAHEEAQRLCFELLALDPWNVEALQLLALFALNRGDRATAGRRLQQAAAALHRHPDSPQRTQQLAQVLNNMGILYLEENEIARSIASQREALQLRPDMATAHCNLALALERNGERDLAVTHYREALRLERQIEIARAKLEELLNVAPVPDPPAGPPGNDEAAGANALMSQDRHEEALLLVRRAIELAPDNGHYYNLLGLILYGLKRFTEAIAAYDRAIALSVDPSKARCNRSMAYRMLGRWTEAWEDFEARWKIPDLEMIRRYPNRLWDGSSLRGKTLILCSTFGHGDAINYIRFLPELVARGARVLVACQAALKPLFARHPFVAGVLEPGDPIPAFDYHLPIEGLMRRCGATTETVARCVPYIAPPLDLIGPWERRLAGIPRRRIGLVWAGQAYSWRDHRLRTLSSFAPLAAVAGSHFIGLQHGEEGAQSPPLGMDFTNLSGEVTDFAQAAAAIWQLDLLISVDTAAAHLAGAMAKPVWVLIPYDSDCRWLLDRADTPWYPTMRLFRQTRRGTWEKPIQDMVDALKLLPSI